MQEYDLFLANDTYDVQKNSNFANCLNNLGCLYISIFIHGIGQNSFMTEKRWLESKMQPKNNLLT